VSVESRFEWWVKFNKSGGGRDECEHSPGSCVRITVGARHCLWASLEKKGKFCECSDKET